ncbi:hypothetical protein D3C87_1824730 [compost metagenome]
MDVGGLQQTAHALAQRLHRHRLVQQGDAAFGGFGQAGGVRVAADQQGGQIGVVVFLAQPLNDVDAGFVVA